MAFIADFSKCSLGDPPSFDAKACFAAYGGLPIYTGLPPTNCGNGKCEEGESNCPLDCKGSGAGCGDLKCGPGENWGNCTSDCFPPLTAVDLCLMANCKQAFNTCMTAPFPPGFSMNMANKESRSPAREPASLVRFERLAESR